SHTPRPWTPEAVARILTNPVYTGATVWGRTIAGRPIPPEEWVVCQDAHEPIVDGRTFFAAQLLAPRGTGIISPQFPAWDFLNAHATGPQQGSWEANPKPFI
ncbi:recombinase family protein, partial [Parafrankia sp. FMc6]|uniref:recombinase family protein n=1 Tax=Parafrankia soli TaxID=2599596 RepID=UPI0034D471F2